MSAGVQSDPSINGLPAHGEPQSVATLLRRLFRELATLLRQEFALAGAELTHALRSMITGAFAALAGTAVAFAGVLVLLAAAVLGLSQVMPAWLAAVLVGAAVTLVGAAALFIGVRRLRPGSLAPQRTVRSLSKDKAALLRRVP